MEPSTILPPITPAVAHHSQEMDDPHQCHTTIRSKDQPKQQHLPWTQPLWMESVIVKIVRVSTCCQAPRTGPAQRGAGPAGTFAWVSGSLASWGLKGEHREIHDKLSGHREAVRLEGYQDGGKARGDDHMAGRAGRPRARGFERRERGNTDVGRGGRDTERGAALGMKSWEWAKGLWQ